MSDSVPNGWSKVEFDNFTTLQRGKDLTKAEFREGTVPVAGSNGVIGYHDTAIARAPGITVGRSGSAGKVTVYEEDFWPHNTSLYVRDFHGNDPYFAGFLLGSLNLARFKTGASVPTLDRNSFKTLPVLVPPLPEQKKIAHILSTVQRAIEAQERIIQTTTELKKALMHKLFTEGLRNEPQKQTEIGPVPESWEVRKLGDIATTISKGSSPKWQGFQYTESGILFVRSQNVGSGKMLLDDRAYLPTSFNEKEKRSILQSGDILINLVGASIGRVALGTDEIEGGNCNQAVGFVRLKGAVSLKQLIVYFLLSPWGQEQMRRQKKDIARANLSLLDVRGFEIPIPSTDEEIDEVARALVTLEEKTAAHERKRDQLQDLFRTLLHELMTAKTRVHELTL